MKNTTPTGYKRPLTHIPLEPYRSRYTEWLHKVEKVAFEDKGYKLTQLAPSDKESVAVIRSGRVLDALNRPLWAMKQMAMLLSRGADLGKVYFSDFFHPGMEALPYSGATFEAYSFLWAQTFDCFDFTAPMWEWMRPWEIMALSLYTKVFVACDELKELIVAALPAFESKVVVVHGLPFNSAMVRDMLKPEDIRTDKFDVVYSSRWDHEKNPSMFLQMVSSRPDLQFAICTGDDVLRGTDTASVVKAQELFGRPKTNLRIFTGLSKSRYYAILAASKVQFNCSAQDWVSFTLLESLTFGCKPLYPAHRSFPSVFLFDRRHLYRPYDVQDALNCLEGLLSSPPHQSEELGRMILASSDAVMGIIANEIGQ